MKTLLIATLLATAAPAADAGDWSFGISIGSNRKHVHTSPRVKILPTTRNRVWVAGHYDYQTIQVCTRSGAYRTRRTRVWVPGYWKGFKVRRPHRHGPDCSVHVEVDY